MISDELSTTVSMASTAEAKLPEGGANLPKKRPVLLECQNVSKAFTSKSGTIQAVNDINLKIFRGECYGLVGESGCGKSTLSSMICALQKPDSGRILFKNRENTQSDGLFQTTGETLQAAETLQSNDSDFSDISTLRGSSLKDFRRRCQIIFQDPYSSLNPKMTIGQIIEEPLKIHHIGKNREERLGLVNEIRTNIGLPPETVFKYPGQLSGGQRQRVAIASAMILEPEFVICDESVSALDVLIQAQILNLLKSMQKTMNLTYLFISHNLNVVAYMADRIGVMYKGQIVEEKSTEELLKNPEHPYTKTLLNAAGLSLSSRL